MSESHVGGSSGRGLSVVVHARACIAVLIALFASFGWSAGGSAHAAAADQANHVDAAAVPRVVATFSVIGDMVRQIGGDEVRLTVLVGGDADPHLFDPSASDARRLSEADLVLEHGLGLEGWIDRLYRASGSKAPRITVSDAMQIRRVGTSCCDAHADGLPVDPHTWHSVANAREIARAVAQALASAAPHRAELFQKRAAALDAELSALDAWVRDQVNRIPSERRRLVTAHESLGYFAEEYGFEVIGVVIPSMSTEAADRSPSELAALVRQVRAAAVPAIFADASHSTRLARTVAREAGVATVVLLRTDGLGATPQTDTYVRMMRSNVTAIVEALVPVMAQQESGR